MYQKIALIVDDSATARSTLSHQLSRFDVVVESAPDGNHALEILLDHTPDMIFLDHIMPGLNGFEVLQLLKNNNNTKRIPVVMYTSQAAPEYAKEAKFLGAIAVIPKNVTNQELMEALDKVELYHLKAANDGFNTTESECASATGSSHIASSADNTELQKLPFQTANHPPRFITPIHTQTTDISSRNGLSIDERIRINTEHSQQTKMRDRRWLVYLLLTVSIFVQFHTVQRSREQEYVISDLRRQVLQQDQQYYRIQSQLELQENQLGNITSRQIELIVNLLATGAGSEETHKNTEALHQYLEPVRLATFEYE